MNDENPMAADDSEEHDEYFDASEFTLRVDIEDTHYWHVHRRRIVLRELRAFGAAPDRLIELGCGIGTVATYLNENGYEVDYADMFGGALEIAGRHAKNRLGAAVDRRRFLRIDITKSIASEEYRGILLFDVIEHLPDDERVLRNVHAATSSFDDAFVMVTVPAYQILWSPWDDIERHKRRYTRSGLTSLLARCGFEVTRVTYFFSPLFFAALAVKGVRTVRNVFVPPAPAHRITELLEGQSKPWLNRVALAALSFEHPWLDRASLPFGTSILAVARRR